MKRCKHKIFLVRTLESDINCPWVVCVKAKGEGEKERYILLNAEFQRITRRDKKAFISEQCKEIEKTEWKD